MNDAELLYEEARKEWLAARKDAGIKLEEAIAFARKQGRAALNDADRVYKLRVSETRNPHCHVCNLDTIPGRCNCNYKCPSTLCKGES